MAITHTHTPISPALDADNTVYRVVVTYGESSHETMYRTLGDVAGLGIIDAITWIAAEGGPTVDLVPVPTGIPGLWWWTPARPERTPEPVTVEAQAWHVHTSPD